MKGVFFTVLTAAVIILLTWGSWSQTGDAVLNEGFNNVPLSVQGQAIVEHPFSQVVDSEGVDGTPALKVEYQGFERGSRRVVATPRIPRADVYELSFWVQFCEGFDFARGGKLHGLGPARPVTGGDSITPEGWSARLMFRGDGGLQTYVYHQDMAGRFGDTEVASGFSFEPGRYHHVVMRVRMNTPASARNGSIEVWVDDKLVIQHEALRFRDRVTPESNIQRLLFSTFHGGSSPEWAPRNDDGSYKTDCAFFDDITVTSST